MHIRLYIKIFFRSFKLSEIAFFVMYLCYPLVLILSIDIAHLFSYSLIATLTMGFMPFMFILRRGIFMDLSQRIVQSESIFNKFITLCIADALTLSIMPIGLLLAYYLAGNKSPIFAINIVLMHAIATMIFTDIKMLAMRNAKCSVVAKLCGSLSSFTFIPIAYKCGHPEQRTFLDTFEAFYQQHEGAICIALLIACTSTVYGISRHVRRYLSTTPFPSPTVIQKFNKNYWY